MAVKGTPAPRRAGSGDPRILPESSNVRAPPPVAPARPTRLRAPTTTSASTPGSGCASATTPRCSTTSRRERVHRGALAHTARRCATRSSTRSSAACRRPTRRAPVRAARGSTSPAPSKACSTACTAGGPRARPGSPIPFAPPGTAAGEQVVLDENVLAGEPRLLRRRRPRREPDHSLVAYTTDITGGERYDLRFRAARDDRDGPRPRRRRPRRLLRRCVGERQRHDPLHASRRRDAPVADLAARARHAGRRRRARVPGGRRPLLRRRRAHPHRPLPRDHERPRR